MVAHVYSPQSSHLYGFCVCFFCCFFFKVIKPESCVPCGKRIKFGKISLKCRDCRVVAHPECRERCPLPCIPSMTGTPVKSGEVTNLYMKLYHPTWVFSASFTCWLFQILIKWLCCTLNSFKHINLFQKGTLASYVSSTSPMIPSLVVHCVNEIEQRGLREVNW